MSLGFSEPHAVLSVTAPQLLICMLNVFICAHSAHAKIKVQHKGGEVLIGLCVGLHDNTHRKC